MLTQPPAAGEWREIGDGLLWLRMPLPGKLTHINVWLASRGDRWWLIDTGMATTAAEEAWTAIDRRLELQGRLESIVVTHHHPDHFGRARRLSERYGCTIRMSRSALEAARRMEGGIRALPAESVAAFERHFGAPVFEMARESRAAAFSRATTSGVPEHVLGLTEGEAVEIAGSRWLVSLHDGHASGHACLFDQAGSRLISGDQVLPTISSNVSLLSLDAHDDPWADYLASLARLRELPSDTLVLPAHGLPFRGLHPRIDALAAEHAKRSAQIAALCSEGRGVMEVAREVFRYERLDPFNRMLALGETLAHVRWLDRQGRLERIERAGEVRWRSVDQEAGASG